MMNAFRSTGWGSPMIFSYGVHALGMLIVTLGIALLLFWAFKTLSEKKLWQWGWILVVVGAVLCLLTLPAWPAFGMGGGMMNGWQRGGTPWMMPMMAASYSDVTDDDIADVAQEEAEGKVLYDKFQAGEITCDDLSDDDAELIGEYVMGQRLGEGHASMNAMMKQMMGEEGEEQMHISLGLSAVGCSDDSVGGLVPGRGMMGGGMRWFSKDENE